MIGLLRALMRARAVRPLLWWVLVVLLFVALPLPGEWVLLLIVGLGVALTMTFMRLREGHDHVRDNASRAWQVAERLAGAVEDRIRGEQQPPTQLYPPGPMGGHMPQAAPVYGQLGGPNTAYDPGALLSAIVAVLAAEGLPTNAAPALPAVAQLLADQGIQPHPGVVAPTALGFVEALLPGPQRPHRAMPPGLLASVIRALLVQDQALPQEISTDAADDFIADSAVILQALHIAPNNDAGSLHDWPTIAHIIDAVPLPAPHDPPTNPYGQWDR